MRLGLGIGVPYGSGVLNPDKLSLDLQFATDKTLTARKGPTPTFTRVSGATRVNASGLIEYAPENLLLRSDDFGNATWQKFLASVTTNTAVSPSGITDADTLIETATTGQHYTFQQIAKETGSVTYCFSVYYKNAIGTRNLMLALTNGTSSGKAIIFTTSGAITATNLNVGSGAGFTFISANVDTLSGGWYRASIVIASDSANRLDAVAYLNTSATSVSSYAGDGVSGIYLWGAQLERNAVARTYNPTTASQFYAPRFDHDPVTLACKGLLIEESRQNLFRHSENLNDAVWTKIGCSISANNTASPDGSITADKIVENTANTLHGAIAGSSVATNTTYIGSIYVKASERGFAMIYTDAGGGNGRYISIPVDGSGQVLGAFNANSSTVTLQYVGNGWYRATIVVNTGAKSTITLEVYPSTNGTSASYLGDGTSGIFAWGAQLEAGSFPTSYIPTTSTVASRGADVCSITGANFTSFYNQSEWTLYADVSGLMSEALGGQRPFVGISDGTYSNFFSILKASASGSFQAEALTSGALQFRLGNAYTPYTRYKIALGAKTNDANAAYNGVLKTTDTTVTMPSTMNRLEFRDPTAAAAGHPSCHIAQIQYFRKRLPDAKLQSLTTP